MARRMTWPGAVIGIQARGFAAGDAPHATVEAMAAEYRRAVKARQPNGPYYLCGYSSGGLVAFEMARRLRESGDEVALVGLFDTMMSPLRWPFRSWLSLMRRPIVQFAAGAMAVPIRTWPDEVRKMGRRTWEGLRRFLRSMPRSVLRVQASAFIASARYRPGYYPGELTLFTPMERDPGIPSPLATWQEHGRVLSIVETAGTHWTMFSAPNAESIAASLTLRLMVCSERTFPSVAASPRPL